MPHGNNVPENQAHKSLKKGALASQIKCWEWAGQSWKIHLSPMLFYTFAALTQDTICRVQGPHSHRPRVV